LRGGRLSSVRKDVVEFTSSIKSDHRLLKPVIIINEAHVAMIMEQKIIEWNDRAKLLQALSELQPNMKLLPSLEDVHMAVEDKVIKRARARTSHRIVGALVRILVERKLTLSDVTPELLQKAAKDSLSPSLNINVKDILNSTDPLKFIENQS
jgi:argininosuccinate lyase